MRCRNKRKKFLYFAENQMLMKNRGNIFFYFNKYTGNSTITPRIKEIFSSISDY